MESFMPLAEEMAVHGYDSAAIARVIERQVDIRRRRYYDHARGPVSISHILSNLWHLLDKQTADSKAESIFYDMLASKGIRFEFQYAIGPYRADFLFADFIVLEIDGPQHNKDYDDVRDKYMRGLGYKIIRVPLWVLTTDPEAVIEEIQEAICRTTGRNAE
jgi:very-short-patch-repair endonuclease